MNSGLTESAIGVFDSGVGGLSVLRAAHALLPHEQFMYIADSAHAPYGERDAEHIVNRCLAITEFLHRQPRPVKALVVACNTASVLAIDKLRNAFDIPIVGIEPAIKPAASITRSGVVGVMATSRTVQSPGVKRLCELYGQNVEVILKPCPGLVDCIERAELSTPETVQLLSGFITPMLDAGADTIVLGCTHYPFVRDAIQKIVGNSVTVIEPGAAVARQLGRQLDRFSLRAKNNACSVGERTTFYSTGKIGDAAATISLLWGRPVAIRYLDSV